jgi:hypothetical protein
MYLVSAVYKNTKYKIQSTRAIYKIQCRYLVYSLPLMQHSALANEEQGRQDGNIRWDEKQT